MAKQVVNAAVCKCAFGTAPVPLMAQGSAKVICCKQNAATIMDNKFVSFGNCTNPANPAVVAAQGAPVPCTPVIAAPWVPGSPTVLIGGKPALNESCTLMCSYPGGIIKVQPPVVTTVNLP